MLSATQTLSGDLHISYKDRKLQNPYVAVVEISNVGRAPVAIDDFSQSRPLQFELQAPIVTALTVEHEPASAPTPRIVLEGKGFSLQPEVLVKNEIIKATLLTEGQPGNVKVSMNPFAAIQVQLRDREAWLRQRDKRRGVAAVISLISVAALTIALIIVTAISTSDASSRENNAYKQAYSALIRSSCINIIDDLSGADVVLYNAISFRYTYVLPKGKVDASPKLNSKHLLTSFEQAVGQLTSDYASARRAGLQMGNAAGTPKMAERAVALLEQLPLRETSQANNTLKTLDKIAGVLNGQQSVPQECRHASAQ